MLVLDPRLGYLIIRKVFVLRNWCRDAWLGQLAPKLHDVCEQSHSMDPPEAIVSPPRRSVSFFVADCGSLRRLSRDVAARRQFDA